MKRVLGLGAALLAALAIGACTGPQGPAGQNGKDGTNGAGGGASASVSAVTPDYAYLGRTVDLSIAGSGTAWSSSTTVTFADPKITVNKVIAASATGLLVNVTIAKDASVAATDVTVKDGSNSEVYKGAFQVKAPLAVTIDQTGGVPQGGFANVHVQMMDVTTPFDANTATPTLSATDVVLAGTPSVTDYGMDFLVAADVLATMGENVDLTISSGPKGSSVDSPAKAAFQVAARAPKVLTTTTPGSGMINTTSDSALYSFTPAAATTRFIQYNVSSADGGGVLGIAVPKSGKIADNLGAFGVRFGMGMTSTDVTYMIITDSGSPFASPPPYSFDFSVTETACTALAEQAGAHTDSGSAQAVSMLPALITGDMTSGSSQPDDYYAVTVSGASAASPKTIHIASGGDGLSNAALEIDDTDGTTALANDAGDDYHVDATASVTKPGTYYVKVSTGQNFDPAHSKYDLFIEVK